MARKIRFALEMADGSKVRNLEDLRAHFNLDKIINYYLDGRLEEWLSDRYYEDEFQKIIKLDQNSASLERDLYDILGVEYDFEKIDINKLKLRNEKIDLLKNFDGGEEYISVVDEIAFSQKELEELRNKGNGEIYLFGEVFYIDLQKNRHMYKGIGMPTVYLSSEKDEIRLDDLEITFEHVKLESDKKVFLMSKKMDSVKCGSNVKFRCIPNKKIAEFKLPEKPFLASRIRSAIYKNLLIYWEWDTFYIVDIYTKKAILTLDDIFPQKLCSYKRQCIWKAKVYKDSLVIYWGDNENTALQIINLKTLQITGFINLPADRNHISGEDIILDIFEGTIGLYGNSTYSPSSKNICQYHEFPLMEFIKKENIGRQDLYNANFKEEKTIYKGHFYKLFDGENKIISNNPQYVCNGFYYKNKRGTIGMFRIGDNKIYATNSRENYSDKQMYNSIPNMGEICRFDITGGEVEKRVKTDLNRIDGLICLNDLIIIWNRTIPEVYFYDIKTFGKVASINLELKDEYCDIEEVVIDDNLRKMVILYNKKMVVFE